MMKKTAAYPLEWPLGYPRTKWPKRAVFRQSFAKSRDLIMAEIKRLGGKEPIISTNIPLRGDGLPYATYKSPQDHGVAVYFTWKAKQMVLACDKWNKIEDNMTAIAKTISSIRGIERWGVSDFLERSFTGFEALPEKTEVQQNWWDVLRCQEHSSYEFVQACYRALVKEYHPDNQETGDSEKFQKIQSAWEFFRLYKVA